MINDFYISICFLILLIIIIILLWKIHKLSRENHLVSMDRLRIERNWRTETKWLENISEGKKIVDFLHKNNYNTASIYGIGYMGKFLFKEIKDDIDVKFIIDKNSTLKSYNEVPVIKPSNITTQDSVDLIIVTAVTYYEEILDDLHEFGCNIDSIISLEDILWSL